MKLFQTYTIRVTKRDGYIFRNSYQGVADLREGLARWAAVLLPNEKLEIVEGTDGQLEG